MLIAYQKKKKKCNADYIFLQIIVWSFYALIHFSFEDKKMCRDGTEVTFFQGANV